MHFSHAFSAAMSFAAKWTSDIWPVVQAKYNHVLLQRTAKQDCATGVHYGTKVYDILPVKKEIRNVSCNLAFTDPIGNTILQKNISYATVERFAIDMYIDPVVTDDDQLAAPNDKDTSQNDGAAGRRAEKTLSSTKKWKIPDRVPRGYEIPIAITNQCVEPEKGRFRRMGLDVAVNATWLAMKWAIDDGNRAAEIALEKLMLDWPFDFYLFEGSEDEVEEQIMKHIINLPAATERLRDFCGLDTSNLMRIAGEVQELLKDQSQGKAIPSPEKVYQWLINPDNIKWGVYHVPSLRTIKDLLKNWDALKKNRQPWQSSTGRRHISVGITCSIILPK